MTRLAYRSVVSGAIHAVLPDPARRGETAAFRLHFDARFHGMAFHPDRPSLAICQLIAFEGQDPPSAMRITTLVMSPERLRFIGTEMLAIADELEIKPRNGALKS